MKYSPTDMLLVKAIEKEQIEEAQSFIAQGANVDFTYSNGVTLLMDAIRKNSAFEKILINAGANVTAQDENGYTALHYAAQFISDNIQALLDRGADTNAVSKQQQKTPLMLVGEWSTKPAQKTIKALIKHGAEIERADIFRQTPLFHAIEYGNITAAEELLAHKANVNAVNAAGYTPLEYAVRKAIIGIGIGAAPALRNNRISIIKCLLNHGADANETILKLAAQFGGVSIDIMRILALEGSKGKNRYANIKGFLSEKFFKSGIGPALHSMRQQQLKENALYHLTCALLNEKKVDFSKEQLEENKSLITGMKILAGLPGDLKTRVLSLVHQGKELTYSHDEDKKAKRIVNDILGTRARNNAILEVRNAILEASNNKMKI